MQVVGADGSDFGAVGEIRCNIEVGDAVLQQDFIVCKHLRRNIILGTDFTKKHLVGVSWTREGTRILSIRSILNQLKGLGPTSLELPNQWFCGCMYTDSHIPSHIPISARFSTTFSTGFSARFSSRFLLPHPLPGRKQVTLDGYVGGFKLHAVVKIHYICCVV